MKKINDERITSQIHRFGFEAFVIMAALVFISFVVKAMVLNREAFMEFILLMAGLGYFTVRSAIAGAVAIPAKSSEKSVRIKRAVFGFLCASVAWGVFIGIRNTYLYMGCSYSMPWYCCCSIEKKKSPRS